jgi:hypothetical protein
MKVLVNFYSRSRRYSALIRKSDRSTRSARLRRGVKQVVATARLHDRVQWAGLTRLPRARLGLLCCYQARSTPGSRAGQPAGCSMDGPQLVWESTKERVCMINGHGLREPDGLDAAGASEIASSVKLSSSVLYAACMSQRNSQRIYGISKMYNAIGGVVVGHPHA